MGERVPQHGAAKTADLVTGPDARRQIGSNRDGNRPADRRAPDRVDQPLKDEPGRPDETRGDGFGLRRTIAGSFLYARYI